MQPHLVLRFTLGLLFGTSAAIVIPRAANGTLQERTTIYFPGPIPGRSDTRAVHDVRVPDGLTKRTNSDATTTELLSSGDQDNNNSNSGKGSSKRAESTGEATPGTKSDKYDPNETAMGVSQNTFKVIGQIALGVFITVIICAGVVVWYKHHKKERRR